MAFVKVTKRFFRKPREVYDRVYAQSIDASQMNVYWDQEAKAVSWFKDYASVFDGKDVRFPDYFKGGELNVCFNAVDRHLDDLGDHSALIYESQPLGIRKEITFSELHQNVCKMALKMKQLGIEKGDRILLYMPMIPEAVYTMLAAARLGAPHVVVFGGFAAKELASRIEDSTPKLIVTASHGFEPSRAVPYKLYVSEALNSIKHKPEHILIKDRTEEINPEYLNNGDAYFNCSQHCLDQVLTSDIESELPECVPVPSGHELYVIHTSGTTGRPKGVVRDSGGHLVSLLHSMKYYKNCAFQDRDEVFLAASDIGWVVGHSFSVYGPLANGNSSVLYEGKPIMVQYPYIKNFPVYTKDIWSVLQENKVTKLYIAATNLRAIRSQDPTLDNAPNDLTKHLQVIYSGGERCDPSTVQFYSNKLDIPVVDSFWQTETGAPVIGFQDTKVGTKYGSCGLPVPGFNIKLQSSGELCMKLPLPPGCLKTVYNDNSRYIDSYLSKYQGYYFTGDVAEIDDDGYFSVMSRSTDMINTSGHRLSTGLIEESLSRHPDVIECAIVGRKDDIKGYVPFAFVVVRRNSVDLFEQLQYRIKNDIGPIALLGAHLVVSSLPKTRSAKILRGTLQKILNNENFVTPATIEEPSVLQRIQNQLQ